MIGTILAVIFCIIVIAACCAGDDSSSRNNSAPKRNTQVGRNSYRGGGSYDECPSCGASGYDGYCDECGYPDVNLGWLGEEYG